jgi:hypothetical protein
MTIRQRHEFHEALLEADSFEDLRGKWQAAILEAEAARRTLRIGQRRLIASVGLGVSFRGQRVMIHCPKRSMGPKVQWLLPLPLPPGRRRGAGGRDRRASRHRR